VEFSVLPLFSPQSLIAEGSANYGIRLAFPGREKASFESANLFPLAGISEADAGRYNELLEAMRDLDAARMTIARDFLDGRITEEQAIALQRKYGPMSEKRAEHAITSVKKYRSYLINERLGEEMIREDVESRRTPAERWKRFEQIISEPTVPSDLKPLELQTLNRSAPGMMRPFNGRVPAAEMRPWWRSGDMANRRVLLVSRTG
jgi:hypothetical protein